MKRIKQFLSLLLAFVLILSAVPMTAQTIENEPIADSEEIAGDDLVLNAPDATAPGEEREEMADLPDFSFASVLVPALTADVTVDKEDPQIIAFEKELDEVKVLGANGDPGPMTEEQKQQVLGLYQQYLDHWNANKHILGAQTPFFLAFNDTKDELGILGEMLVMAGVSVDVVRAGYMTFDDVTGMIMNFFYGDTLGVALYGSAIEAAREEALQAVKDSGAKTMAQKLLVLNDWLAHHATYDVTYIMNSGKDEDKKPMIAENPQQHKYYQTVYDVIYDQYEEQITAQFHDEIYAGVVADMRQTWYEAAIEEVYYQGVYSQAEAQIEEQIYNQAYEEAYAAYIEANTPTEEPTDEVDPEADAFAKEQAEKAVADNADTIAEQADAVATEETEKFMTENAEAIEADAGAFIDSHELFQTEVPMTDANGIHIIGKDGNLVMITLAAQLHAGCDDFIETAETEGVLVQEGVVMTIEQIVQVIMENEKIVNLGTEEQPYMVTANEVISIYADQAATSLTKGVLDYWKGSHIGVLGDGYGVCLGYTKAFTYLVQCLNADIYTTNGDYTAAANWKSNEDLYYTNGALDINKGYVVDSVRITFDASVTMFGQTEDNFNNDHFWNSVKVDGQWYYLDTCYTDVYDEFMMRDRVETDGYMNHMYFLFSHNTAVQLYDGNYKEIKTLYETAANDKGYEDSWFSRIKSNVYSDGIDFYYVYDSADLITIMNEFSMDNIDADAMSPNEYKLVAHTIASTDKKSTEGEGTPIGDTDYITLVEFNHPIDPEDNQSETVARYLNAEGKMVESELLTKLYAEHSEYAQKYPSLAICSALYQDRLYFNVSNCILYYDLNTGEVVLVKEYNTVSAQRDKTNCFGGMAFTVCDENQADFTVSEHPIAGMTIKADGNMYVSIATNFAFISGKEAVDDQTSYGYEYEETNYNPSYSNFGGGDYSDMMESMGYDTDNNDNDEFAWSANFVEILPVSHLNGFRHNYASVTVAPTCTEGGYTENRCSTCGRIQADSRTATEDEAHDHHYIRFDETYYTTAEDGTANTGYCYICTGCYDAVSEPTKPQENDMYEDYGTSYEEQMELYEERKAEYNAIAEVAGHDLTPANATWDTNNNTVTFSELTVGCDCAERNTVVDHLLGFTGENITLTETYTVNAEITVREGNCVDGGTIVVYGASGEVEGYKFTATYELQKAAGKHSFEAEATWNLVTDENGKAILDENGNEQYTVDAELTCTVCDTTYSATDVTATFVAESSYESTCEAPGLKCYTATIGDQNLGTITITKSIEIPVTGHIFKSVITEPTCTTAGYVTCTCTVCGSSHFGETVAAYGHTVETLPVVAPTCTEGGLTEGSYCTVCGEVFAEQEEIPPTGHVDENEDYLCDVCGENLCPGHIEGIIPGIEASCTEWGLTEGSHCVICGMIFTEQEEIPPAGHVNADKDNSCDVCGDHLCAEDAREIIPGKEATCTKGGVTEGLYCTLCGEILIEQFILPATGHNYLSVVTAPTCTEQGYTTYTCSSCGNSYVETVASLGHTYQNGKCTVCGQTDPDYGTVTEIASGWSGSTQWTLTDDGTLTVYGTGNMKNYGYNGGQPWLSYADQITSVVIEDGITAVGTGAFMNLTKLKSVTLPNSGLAKIGEAAFYGCTALKEIYIPDGVYTIWNYTFKGCSSLTDIRLPKTLIKIDQGAFENCTALDYIYIPGNTEIIGSWSFKGCTSLVEADMQWADATEIREGAFKNCTALTTINLPEDIQILGDSCFYGIGAASFTVPSTVTEVGPWCFARAKLSEIIFEGDAPTIGEGAFNKITLTAYYPGNNATWSADVMQNYGGKITWKVQ